MLNIGVSWIFIETPRPLGTPLKEGNFLASDNRSTLNNKEWLQLNERLAGRHTPPHTFAFSDHQIVRQALSFSFEE